MGKVQFAATWMDLEIIILTEVGQLSYDIIFMWNLKHATDELICQIDTDSHTYKTNLWLPKGKVGR